MALQEVSQPQLRELVNNYQPEVIYADGQWAVSYTHLTLPTIYSV